AVPDLLPPRGPGDDLPWVRLPRLTGPFSRLAVVAVVPRVVPLKGLSPSVECLGNPLLRALAGEGESLCSVGPETLVREEVEPHGEPLEVVGDRPQELRVEVALLAARRRQQYCDPVPVVPEQLRPALAALPLL